MTNFRPAFIGDSDNIIQGIPFPRPTSHEYLTPPVLQRNKHYLGVELLQQQELLKRKVTPGLYSKWNEIKGFLPDVQDSLIDSLCAELHGLDSLDLCKRLYDTLEVIYGYLERQRLQSTPEVLLGGRSDGPMEGLNSWLAMSPLTLAIRFLIEMTVKHSPHPAFEAGESKRLHFVALNTRIVDLDFYMDSLYYSVIPYEMTVDDGLKTLIKPCEATDVAFGQWKKDSNPHILKKQKDDLSSASQSIVKPISEDEMFGSPIWQHLDGPMEQELGYSLADRLAFDKALVQFFEEDERLKISRRSVLLSHVKEHTNLSSEKIEFLMGDHILSPEIYADTAIRKMLLSEHFWRDLRITNKPLIQLTHNGQPVIMMGLETLLASSKVVIDRLLRGKMKFPRACRRSAIMGHF